MDSGYPTREVVNTASPEMLELAPNAVPWKTGPSYGKLSAFHLCAEKEGRRRTLMVKVASVLGAAAVALDMREGIDRPLLPSTAGLLRKRAWLGRREARPATLGPEALGRRVARRENILTSTGERIRKVEALVQGKRSYADRALHRWSNKF